MIFFLMSSAIFITLLKVGKSFDISMTIFQQLQNHLCHCATLKYLKKH